MNTLTRGRVALAGLIVGLAWVCCTSAATVVGRTEATYGVTQNGSVSYSIPIRLTEGIAGLTPNLAISYVGPDTRTVFGVGTALSGISYITPCRKTIAQDLNAAPVTLTAADRYCLDGARLRKTSTSAYGASGTTYRTELDQLIRVTSLASVNGIPGSFTAETPDGFKYEYGNTADSKLLASGTANAPPQFWAVNRISDANGNSIVFHYDTNNSLRRFRPDYIQYTERGGVAHYKVAFIYQSTSLPEPTLDFTPSATGGAAKSDDKLLDRIDLSFDSTVYRKYLLTYESGAGSNRRLKTVQECAPVSGYPDDCLAQTTLGWQSATSGHAGAAPSFAVSSDVIPLDINNDGFEDLVWASGGTWRYMLGAAVGFGPAINTNVTVTNNAKAMPLEWNGDGFWDLLIDWSDGKWRVLTGSASGLSTTPIHAGPSPGISSSIANTTWTVADADNDGRDDLFYMQLSASLAINVRFNSATGFGNTTIVYSDPTLHSRVNGFIRMDGASSIRRPDFNGDGRTDLLVYACIWESEPPGYCVWSGWFELLSNGATYVNEGNLPSASLQVNVRYADFNADGLTDVVYPAQTGFWNVGFGQGSGGLAIAAGPSTSPYASYQTLTGDYDGDGYDDFYATTNSPWQWSVLRSAGSALVSSPIPTGISANGLSWMLIDQNGDSLPDLGRYDSASFVWSTYVHLGQPGERLASSIDGLGNAVTFGYLPMTDATVFTVAELPVYPDRNYRSAMPLVRTMQVSPGGGTSHSFEYNYRGARMHVQGRSFLGMGMRTITDKRNDSYVIETFKQGFPLVGALESQKTNQPGVLGQIAHLANQFNHHVLDATPGNERFLPYLSSYNFKVNEVGGPKNNTLITEIGQTRTVNTLGNLVASYTTVTDKDSLSAEYGLVYSIQIANTFVEDQSNWCIAIPTSSNETRTLPSGATQTRSTNWTVTGLPCRVTKEVVEPLQDSTISLTTDIGYDTCGNINLVSSYPTGLINLRRDTAISYLNCHFPSSVTNAENHVTLMTFDSTHGGMKTLTSPNSLMTTMDYDAFGRVTRVLRPDGTAIRIALSACDAGNSWCQQNDNSARVKIAQTERSSTDTVLRTDAQILDGAGRLRWTQSDSLVSGPSIVEIRYDAFDRPVMRTRPYFIVPPYWNTYTYDCIDRLTRVDEPISEGSPSGRITQFAYEGRDIRITDPRLLQTTRTFNVLGQLRKITDPIPGGITTLSYRPFGEVESITDAANNATTWSLNVRGFVTGMTDPDSGSWVYQNNAFGEKEKIRDAKTVPPAFSTEFTFDKLSRPKTRVDLNPAGTTNFSWGTSDVANNIGQLESISSPGNYSENYIYDAQGRLSQRRITADGATYYFDLAYQPQTGLLDTVQYPTSTSGYRLKLAYDYSNMLLQKVRDFSAGTAFWQATSTDAFGHIQDEVFGNNVHTYTGYDQANGLMIARLGGVGGGAALINATLDWDMDRNLKERADLNLSPTVAEKNFVYDGLNRLVSTERAVGAGTPAPNLNVTYDLTGNITNKDGQQYWYTGNQTGCTYYTHAQPRAVRKIGNIVYCYDQNGNMIKRAGSTISYTSYNLPSTINSGSNSSAISYGAFRNRFKQVAVSPSGTETTIYIAGLLEKVTRGSLVEWRHFILGGKGTAAIYTRRTGGSPATDIVYVHRDHLGSPELFTNSSGGIIVRLSFGAFGERRDGNDWDGPPNSGDLAAIGNTTRHGLTGHEHLDAVGLIHMDGRVYDPVAGRFLGVDPIMQGGNSQSTNGFSYVWNNPLTMLDPSGFDPCEIGEICDPGFPGGPPGLPNPTEPERHTPSMEHKYLSNADSHLLPKDFMAITGQAMPFYRIGSSVIFDTEATSTTAGRIVLRNPEVLAVGVLVAGSLYVATHSRTAGLLQRPVFANEKDQVTSADGGNADNVSPGDPNHHGRNKPGREEPTVQFGDDKNQRYHAWRHVDDSGLSRADVKNAIVNDLRGRSIGLRETYTGKVSVDGIEVEYRAHQLTEEIINVGSIKPPM